MFTETPKKSGTVEICCGSMFSGKSSELIRRLSRAKIARLRVMSFMPAMDTRYSTFEVVSHDGLKIESVAVETPEEILKAAQNVDVVGIDEVQFMDDSIVDVVNALADRGIRVICAGLDMDFMGKPFGPMPKLMAIAEHVTKLHAICVRCGDPANHSFRTAETDELVVLGANDAYIPLCRHCFNELMSRRSGAKIFGEGQKSEAE